MLSSLQKFLTLVFLLLPCIYGVKDTHAELFSEEQYQCFKNKRKNIKDRIQFIEERIFHLNVWEENISEAEYYKRFHEQNKFLKELKSLKNEYYNLGSKLDDLFEKNKNLSLEYI